MTNIGYVRKLYLATDVANNGLQRCEFMSIHITITDAELHIMKILWREGPLTSAQIFAELKDCGTGNRNTQKTLLLRLVNKGAVTYRKLDNKSFIYSPSIKQEEYISDSRNRFIDRVFEGSTQKMMLNFVQEKAITKADLQELIRLIGEE